MVAPLAPSSSHACSCTSAVWSRSVGVAAGSGRCRGRLQSVALPTTQHCPWGRHSLQHDTATSEQANQQQHAHTQTCARARPLSGRPAGRAAPLLLARRRRRRPAPLPVPPAAAVAAGRPAAAVLPAAGHPAPRLQLQARRRHRRRRRPPAPAARQRLLRCHRRLPRPLPALLAWRAAPGVPAAAGPRSLRSGLPYGLGALSRRGRVLSVTWDRRWPHAVCQSEAGDRIGAGAAGNVAGRF